MNKPAPCTCLFLDIGGVTLTDGWDRHARKSAAANFRLAPREMEDRHHRTFDTYEEGKLSLDEYPDQVVFFMKRPFTRAQFRRFMFAQSKAYPGMIELVVQLRPRLGLKIIAVSNEARELNSHRIRTFGLDGFVDCFVSSCFVHLRKPDADIGFTHQDPGFIDHVMSKKAEIVRVYLPPDANCLLSVTDHCLRSRHYVNLVIAGKHPAPQWLTMDAAVRHCTEGIGIWQWASNDQGAAPDVVMACCGDVPTLETLAAVSIMRERLSDLKIRVVNVVDLMKLQPQSEHPHGLSDVDFDELVTKDKPVIFAFHAYAWLIHRLTYRRTNHDNIHVRGYKEEGTITTPFDMTVLNDLDRFHLVIDTIDRLPQTGDRGIYLKQHLMDKLVDHEQYIDTYGEDMPEIRNWRWNSPR